MLRGCALSLILLVALMAGYYYWLDQVFEPPGSIIGGCVAGFLVLCCLGAFNGAYRAWKDWSRLSDVRATVELVDGKLTAVSGTIHPLREPLMAPFSHTPCVICEYDIASPQRVAAARAQDNTNSGSDYSGFLMVPCVIRTPDGDVSMLGFPVMEGFVETTCYRYADARNARDFLQSTEFEDRTGVKLLSVLSVFGEIFADDDGLVQKNMRLAKVSPTDLFPPRFTPALERLAQTESERAETDDDDDTELVDEDSDQDPEDRTVSDDEEEDGDTDFEIPKLVEKRVPVGAEVCGIGIYNEVLGGLVPLGSGGPPNRLIRGTAEQIVNRSWSAIFRNFAGGFIGLVLIHGAILGVMVIYHNSPEVQKDRRSSATQAVAKNDLPKLAGLIRRGLNVNFRDAEGRSLLMLAEEPEVAGWLIDHGADVNAVDQAGETPLTFAARFGRTEIVKRLIARNVERNPLSKTTGLTPLSEAISRGHEETANILRQSGAKE